jgi:protein-S-isoprenylcysteine O-methyltransferase Ste14
MSFFDIFQLAAMVFFLIVFLGRTLILWSKQGLNPFVLGAGKKGLPRLIELILFPWLILWILVLILSALHASFNDTRTLWNRVLVNLLPAKIFGLLMILAGDMIFVWALISFGNSWRIGIDEKSAGTLVTNGIFAFSRNPIFVFIDLYFIGTFLLNGTLFFLIFAVAAVIGLHYQILQEEKFLSSKYGPAYRDYCTQAGRYINPKAILHRL